MIENVFAELVKKSRYQKNDLSNKLNISQPCLYNYLTGKRSPDLRVLFDLCCICEYDFGLLPKWSGEQLDADFNRFYYKLSDEKKVDYIKGMSRFISKNNKNLDYLMSDVKEIYLSQNDLKAPESDLDQKVQLLETRTSELEDKVKFLFQIINSKIGGTK